MDGSFRVVNWLKEPHVLGILPSSKTRVLFVDNVSGHEFTEEVKEALSTMNTEIPLLPKNATDLCQPTDSFIIQKRKLLGGIIGIGRGCI